MCFRKKHVSWFLGSNHLNMPKLYEHFYVPQLLLCLASKISTIINQILPHCFKKKDSRKLHAFLSQLHAQSSLSWSKFCFFHFHTYTQIRIHFTHHPYFFVLSSLEGSQFLCSWKWAAKRNVSILEWLNNQWNEA